MDGWPEGDQAHQNVITTVPFIIPPKIYLLLRLKAEKKEEEGRIFNGGQAWQL